ncbi:MAG: hypothetical protein U0003_03640 [Vampirovibrionales bacterium]
MTTSSKTAQKDSVTTKASVARKTVRPPRRRIPAATLEQLEEAFQRQRGVDNFWLDRKSKRSEAHQNGVSPEDAEAVMGTFKRWSSSAVECYLRNAQCEGCYYKAFFSDKPYGCKMDLAVEQLLDIHGKPSRSLLARHA